MRATPSVKRNIRLYCHPQGPAGLTPVANSKRFAMEQMEHRSVPHKQGMKNSKHSNKL